MGCTASVGLSVVLCSAWSPSHTRWLGNSISLWVGLNRICVSWLSGSGHVCIPGGKSVCRSEPVDP